MIVGSNGVLAVLLVIVAVASVTWLVRGGRTPALPGQILLTLDLRHDLSMKADRPVPVYAFGYDWRQPLEVVQAQLGAFIGEVIEKSRPSP